MGGTAAGETEARAEGAVGYAPGVRVAGRYDVVRYIASGGMGDVYEARDLLLGETIALKTMRAGLEPSERAVERLRRELALARRITHPNVCRMHDVGEHEARVFLTMELIDGETLASKLAHGPVPDAALVVIAEQLVAALAAAHAAGVVHRDFKTANVLITSNGRVVVTDFGLARAVNDERHDSLTGEAALLGTPAYMAPEQVEGLPATPVSDIYSLGVVLYELATGTVPFREKTALATATARLHRDVPRPSSLRRGLSLVIESVIMRCLARDPAQRFSRVEDVGVALTSPARRSARLAPILVAAVVAAAAAFAIIPRSGTPSVAYASERFWPQTIRPPQTKANAHVEQAHAAVLREDWTAARELLEQAVAAEPRDPIARALLAQLLDTLGYRERAIDASIRALADAGKVTGEARAFVELVAAQVRVDPVTELARSRLLVTLAPHEPLYQIALVEAVAPQRPLEAEQILARIRAPQSRAESISVDLAAAAIANARGDSASQLERARRAAALASIAGRRHDHVQALVAIASAYWALGDTGAAAHHYGHALALATVSGHPADVLHARRGLLDLDLGADRIRSAAQRHLDNVALLRNLGDRKRLVDELEDAARLLLSIGETAKAATAIDEQRRIASELADPALLGYADSTAAFLALQRGALRDAARFAEQAFTRGRQLRIQGMEGNAFHSWIEALVELDDDAELARARGLRGPSIERLVDSYAALRIGELDRAIRIATTLANSRTREGREAQVVAAHALVEQGHLDRAAELLASAGPGLVGDGAAILATRRLVRAQAALSARRGDVTRALAILDEHAARCGDAELRFCQVPSVALAAQVAVNHHARDATTRIAAALELATRYGFTRTVREMRALSQRYASAAKP